MMKSAILTSLTALLLAYPALGMAQTAQQAPELQAGFVDGFGGGVGTVTLVQAPQGLLVRLEISGLAEGWHGVAFHANGNCSDPIDAFLLAGLPLANAGQEHGFLNPQGPKAGSLPNLWVHGDRTGRAVHFTPMITLDALRDQDGSALIIYAAADDYATQPNGNSGARIACAVIPPA